MAKDKKKAPGGGATYHTWTWWRVLLAAFCILLTLYILAGGINQLATGQDIASWTIGLGQQVGVVCEQLFNNQGPVQITDSGIYLDGATPPAGSAFDAL